MVSYMGTLVYSEHMALTIKNPETIALTRELARRTGQTQTAALTEAVRQALSVATQESMEAKERRVNAILQKLWSNQPAGEADRIRQNMEALYDEQGLPR